MLIHPAMEQLRELKLLGMAEALSEQLGDNTTAAFSFEERLGFLIERERIARRNKLLQSRLKLAKLHCAQACLADVNYNQQRGLDKTIIAKLATGDWVKQHNNLILTGATGTGKSWLACAFAHKTCLHGHRAQYWRINRLLEALELGRADGRYINMVKALAKIDLLILDDWGMVKLKGAHQQHILDVLDDRYQKKSTLITSQLPPSHWHDQIQDTTFADAIMDRLLGEAYQVQLKGPSLRKREVVDKKTISEPKGA